MRHASFCHLYCHGRSSCRPPWPSPRGRRVRRSPGTLWEAWKAMKISLICSGIQRTIRGVKDGAELCKKCQHCISRWLVVMAVVSCGVSKSKCFRGKGRPSVSSVFSQELAGSKLADRVGSTWEGTGQSLVSNDEIGRSGIGQGSGPDWPTSLQHTCALAAKLPPLGR